jgi:ribosome-associated protein
VTEKRVSKAKTTKDVRSPKGASAKGASAKGASAKGAKGPSSRGPKRPTANASDEARRVALAIAAAGLDKKASGIEILDVAEKVDYAEVLVLMSGRSDRHVSSIARGIVDDLKLKHGTVPLSVEGMTAGQWVLLDFNDVVVHVFQQSTRYYYDLEGLWIDAARLKVPEPAVRGDGGTSGDDA